MRFLVVDIETTGMEPPASLIELGWIGVYTDPNKQDTLVHWYEGHQLFGMAEGEVMRADNRAVHHIDPSDLKGLRTFTQPTWAENLLDFAVAHNAEFEAKWLDFGVPWVCTFKCALRLWPEAPSHSNQVLKYFLGVEDRPEHHPPHRALPDALVTKEILAAILETGTPVETLVQWTKEPRLMPVCPIGKWKGTPWAEVERSYLTWMTGQADMEHDLRWNAQRELDRRAAANHQPVWDPNDETK